MKTKRKNSGRKNNKKKSRKTLRRTTRRRKIKGGHNECIEEISKKKGHNEFIEEISKKGGLYDTKNNNKAFLSKILYCKKLLTFENFDLYKSFQINGRTYYDSEKIFDSENPETNEKINVNFNTFIDSMEKGNKYNIIIDS